ncbi:DUF413 domain-containing protein [Vibrio sp. ZSDE26]|uniref:DUF413 domain-containing protein n=1 Tax=Vibrio amylolyticus TaxID=2847292 RepID=A0A9X2BLQ1_9VIBR|nr:DUF413 domain-containing protein [Vibrio amylolyticus]MCK6265852.1 DUF413 domain-containing protein [Vibrio amylolyticus]
MISHLLETMATVESAFPDSHMKILKEGGFDVVLSSEYSAETKHLISYAGKYLVLLVKGQIEPINQEHQHFANVVQGKAPATNSLENEFILFMQQYPKLVASALSD